MPPFNGKVYPTQPVTSNERQILYCVNQIALQGMPQNRLYSAYIGIAPATNTVTLGNDLKSAQVMGIVGEDGSGMPVVGNDLYAKIASIAGGNFDERNTIIYAIKTEVFANVAGDIIVGVITSGDIVITLNGGHGLSKLWFIVLPAQYQAG